MGMNFPDAPTLNQVFQNYTWDGEKWAYSAVPTSAAPSNANPAMNGAAAPGVAASYSRGDHVHPSDTSRVAKAGDTMTGALTLNADPAAPLQAATKNYVDLNSMTQAAADARFVNVTGDNMTGNLAIVPGTTVIGGIAGLTVSQDSNALKWILKSNASFFGTLTTDQIGGQVGVGFLADKSANSNNWRNGSSSLPGGYIGNPVGPYVVGCVINTVGTANADFTPLTGWGVKTNGGFVAEQSVQSGGTGTTGAYYFGNSGTKSLSYDGTNFAFNGATNFFVSSASIWMNYTNSTGGSTLYFNGAGNKSLGYDGTNFNLTGGPLVVNSGNIQLTGFTADANKGVVYFGTGNTKYLFYDGTNFNVLGGNFNLSTGLSVNAVNTNKVAVLIDNAGGRGFSFGVSSVTDSGIGISDVTYSMSFGSAATHAPVVSINGASVNQTCSINSPAVSTVRLVSITATTAALSDPLYYSLHDLGT
jgi:hypothetical protein